MPRLALILVDFSPDESGDLWGLAAFALLVVVLPVLVGLIWRQTDRRRADDR